MIRSPAGLPGPVGAGRAAPGVGADVSGGAHVTAHPTAPTSGRGSRRVSPTTTGLPP